jgi:hypothetical protein
LGGENGSRAMFRDVLHEGAEMAAAQGPDKIGVDSRPHRGGGHSFRVGRDRQPFGDGGSL